MVALAQGGAQPIAVAQLDLGEVRSTDVLFVLGARSDEYAARIRPHLKAGGRILLADDTGTGEALLAAYGIERRRAGAELTRILTHPGLIVAVPYAQHQLSEGVAHVVTNYPRVLRHALLRPVFSFEAANAEPVGPDDPAPDALVLAGQDPQGGGRLVAISDPSIFINHMMTLRGNRQLAVNLGRYVAPGRVLLITPDTKIVGEYGAPGADKPFGRVELLLRRLNETEIPPEALKVLSLTSLALLAILLLSIVPRASHYDELWYDVAKPALRSVVDRYALTDALRDYAAALRANAHGHPEQSDEAGAALAGFASRAHALATESYASATPLNRQTLNDLLVEGEKLRRARNAAPTRVAPAPPDSLSSSMREPKATP